MAAVEGGLGGSCFFGEDCGVPLYCHVEGLGGNLITFKCILFNITFSVREGTCRLPGWAIGSVVVVVVLLLLLLLCFCCCCGLVRRRRRAMLEGSKTDLVMF